MTGNVYGADVAELRALGEKVSRSADDLDRIANLLTHQITATTAWAGPNAQRFRADWSGHHRGAIASSGRALRDCAAALRRNADEQDKTSAADSSSAGLPGAGTGAGATPAATGPPGLGSPADNAAWWKSLSPQQQQQVIAEHPEWIGNRDGIPATARDQANRALLEVYREQLLAEKKRLEGDLADNWHPDLFTGDDEARDLINDKLKSLDAIQAILNRSGDPSDRQLLVLDVGPERAEAAIATGNVDTADNVAVFVPGLSTTVDGDIDRYDKQMAEMKGLTEEQSLRVGSNESAATVTWIGYQAPQNGPTVLGVGRDWVTPGRSVATDYMAQEGAAKLVPFLQGIGAGRESDPHLTLLGHSYGSTVSGLANRQDTGVDDFVIFGSPGIGTSNVGDLKVPAGHTYMVEAQDDPVGDAGGFGGDPSFDPGIKHLSSEWSRGERGFLDGSTGHSEYLNSKTTSQQNMSLIVGGRPDMVVPDRTGIDETDRIGSDLRAGNLLGPWQRMRF